MSIQEQLDLLSLALEGDRGYDQQVIAEVGIAWITTILRKNKDYGSSAFESPVLNPTLSPTSAIEVRMSDKIKRIQSLLNQPAEVKDESIDDSFTDLGAYCLLRQCAKKICSLKTQ